MEDTRFLWSHFTVEGQTFILFDGLKQIIKLEDIFELHLPPENRSYLLQKPSLRFRCI